MKQDKVLPHFDELHAFNGPNTWFYRDLYVFRTPARSIVQEGPGAFLSLCRSFLALCSQIVALFSCLLIEYGHHIYSLIHDNCFSYLGCS